MSRIIRVIIQNSLHQSINRKEVKNREIRYLPNLSIFNLLSFFVLVQQIIMNYYHNYPTHLLYFGEVETPYRTMVVGIIITHTGLTHEHIRKSILLTEPYSAT